MIHNPGKILLWKDNHCHQIPSISQEALELFCKLLFLESVMPSYCLNTDFIMNGYCKAILCTIWFKVNNLQLMKYPGGPFAVSVLDHEPKHLCCKCLTAISKNSVLWGFYGSILMLF